jgi:hypothetical protein
MATIGNTNLTLIDWAKRINPATNAIEPEIAELLSQTNEILTDMTWQEGNLPTGHRLVMRTGLPTPAWRKLNAGIPSSKSTTAQVDEATGMLESKGAVDKDLAMLNGGTGAFRLSENVAHIEAMEQEFAQTLFYGAATAPEEFLGLSARYSTISGAVNGQNILTGSGAGSDNTSIWLMGWSPKSVFGIFPKGSVAGLQHLPVQDGSGDGCTEVPDANGNTYRAFVDRYQWKCGMALKDWRYVCRIPNIDVSNLVTESSPADLIKLMARSLDRLPSMKNIKPAFYMNRTVYSMLKIQALNKSTNSLSIEEAMGQFTLKFLGVPIRKCDQILNTEAAIS